MYIFQGFRFITIIIERNGYFSHFPVPVQAQIFHFITTTKSQPTFITDYPPPPATPF